MWAWCKETIQGIWAWLKGAFQAVISTLGNLLQKVIDGLYAVAKWFWDIIVFKIDGLNETIGKRIGKEVNVSKYLNICNDDNCIYKKFRWYCSSC